MDEQVNYFYHVLFETLTLKNKIVIRKDVEMIGTLFKLWSAKYSGK